MDEASVAKMVRDIIRKELASILMGNIVSNDNNQRSTIQRFPSDSSVPGLRNIQPFGIASSAPKGTNCFITPINNNVTNLAVTGHFDTNKPTTNDGETILYDSFGHVVYLSSTKMQFGSKSSNNPMMLGDIVQSLLSQVLELIANHTHISSAPGYENSVPINASSFTALKSSPVDDGMIISNKCYTEK